MVQKSEREGGRQRERERDKKIILIRQLDLKWLVINIRDFNNPPSTVFYSIILYIMYAKIQFYIDPEKEKERGIAWEREILSVITQAKLFCELLLNIEKSDLNPFRSDFRAPGQIKRNRK